MSQAPTLAPAPTLTPPRLLIEWSSPWEEFVSAIRPAFSKSSKPLAGEARTGIFPYRGMLAGWVLEACSCHLAREAVHGAVASVHAGFPA
jgi:hypothetical protein